MKRDAELEAVRKIIALLAPMRAIQRGRVLEFVTSRVESMNEESDPPPASMDGIGDRQNPGLFGGGAG